MSSRMAIFRFNGFFEFKNVKAAFDSFFHRFSNEFSLKYLK